MVHRRSGLITALIVVSLLAVSTIALAQGASNTAPLTGTVADPSGGVLPGVTVVAKNNATAAQFEATTDPAGRFTINALNPGVYTVTISLSGFNTLVLPDVQILSGTPANVNVKLQIGKVEETVVVRGAAEVVQTQTASVQTTLQVQQIQQLPLVTRTALDFVTALPGVSTVGGGSRTSTINGLPGVTINITLDGVNVQDNNNRGPAGGGAGGDGFFMYIRPMLDSVEEITVSSSTPGADAGGQGASNIRFVTRSGSSKFSGSAYNTWRNQAGKSWIWGLNTPYYFDQRDKPRQADGSYFMTDVRLKTPGFRMGGPISVPGLFDGRDKAFFFFNMEWFLWPNQMDRQRYLLTPAAMLGNFTYKANDGSTRTVNLLTDIAARNGQVSAIDPTMAKLLSDIRTAAASANGSVDSWDLNEDRLTYSPGGDNKRYFPTARVDFNLTERHRLSLTTRYNRFVAGPDFLNGAEPRYPGFANWGGQYSKRWMAQASLRSTFGANKVNEFRWGYSGGRNFFYPEYGESQFTCSGPGCPGIPYDIRMDLAMGPNNLTRTTTGVGPSSRNVPDMVWEDSFSWLKGAHNISSGMSFTQIAFENWGTPQGVVPGLQLGLNSSDPAYKYFTYTSGNFPGGISSTQAGYAQNLYSILTGRVTSLNSQFVLGTDGQYYYNGDRWQKGRMNQLGMFVSDSWKLRSNLTLNGGLRYELQFPFQPDLGTWARLSDWTQVYGISGEGNMFKPGTMTGSAPLLVQFKAGDNAYNMDWNNLAPSIGLAWRPNIGHGWLSKILSADPVLRGGYSLTFTRYGTGDFTGVYGANPGSTRDATRSATLTGDRYIAADGLGLPVLLSQLSRLGPTPAIPAPAYIDGTSTMTTGPTETVAVMDPNITVPYAHQYSFGWQREFGKSMGLEVRYVGNRFVGGWTTENLISTNNPDNQRVVGRNWNMIENGFIAEFQKAQANLRYNIASGKGATFAYTGSGTSPLPIFMAYFAGIPLNDARNQDPAKYTSANFSSSNWYNRLAIYNPDPATMAGTNSSGLQNPSFATNAAAAGLPANFFMVNPSQVQGNANLMYNGGNTRYDSLQFDFRRRLTNGFTAQASYVFASGLTWARPTLRNDFVQYKDVNTVDHALKFNWVYELPFGQGKKWASGVSRYMNYLVGGWEFDGAARIQSGQVLNFGNVRLVNMTDKDLQDMFKLYFQTDASGKERIYMLPQDVIENSIIAMTKWSATDPSGFTGGVAPTGRYIASASSPDCVQAYAGQCAALTHFVRGPMVTKVDVSFVKRFNVGGSRRIEARMDLYNLFNNINFIPITGLAAASGAAGSALSGWEVTTAMRDANASQDPGGRITSFGLRFSW
jgi:hypothetical protein